MENTNEATSTNETATHTGIKLTKFERLHPITGSPEVGFNMESATETSGVVWFPASQAPDGDDLFASFKKAIDNRMFWDAVARQAAAFSKSI